MRVGGRLRRRARRAWCYAGLMRRGDDWPARLGFFLTRSVLTLGSLIDFEVLHRGDGRHGVADVGQQFVVTLGNREVLEKKIRAIAGKHTPSITLSKIGEFFVFHLCRPQKR